MARAPSATLMADYQYFENKDKDDGLIDIQL